LTAIVKKRLNDIDIAKGIGILLIVLGHTTHNEAFKKYIYFFHLPLFFILSGFFFNIKKFNTYWQFLKDNARSLLLPFVTFYVLAYIYWIFVERHLRPGDSQIPLTTPALGLIYGTDYKDYMKPNGAVWFLMALFVAKNFLYFTVRYVKSKAVFFAVLVASVLIGYYLATIHFYKLPFSINSAFMGFFFVGLGYLAKPYYEYLFNGKPLYKIITIIVCLLASFLAINYNIMPDMDYCVYGNVLLFLVGGIGGTILCLFISKRLKKTYVLEYLGRESLIIMGLSEPVKRAVIGVFATLTHHPVEVVRVSVGMSFICTVVSLLIMVPVIFIFTHYLYFLIGTGKRNKKPINKRSFPRALRADVLETPIG
jgi:acyltransferase